MMKTSLIVATLLIAPLAVAEQVNRSAPADPQGEVEISNIAGTVSVTGWDRNEVQITGQLSESVERLDVVSEPKRTVIKVVLKKKDSHWSDDEDTELSIQVPTASRLNINTVSAEVSVQGVSGAQRVQSVSGEISTEVVAEEAEVKTVSGDVQLRGEGKPTVLTVTTVSGDAQVTNVAGEIVAKTVSGDLHLALEHITRATLRSTSGELALRGVVAPSARVDAETVSGDLEFALKAPVNAEFEVKTFSGDIDNCFGPKAESKSEYGPGSELRFKQGDGSARVRLSTLSGTIKLCDR